MIPCQACGPAPCTCIRVSRLDDDARIVGDNIVVSGVTSGTADVWIHHVDGDPFNNDPDNVVIMSAPTPTRDLNFTYSGTLSRGMRQALGLPPDELDVERERLAAARAERQTLAWKYPPPVDDPASILDADDPWA